MSSPTRRWRIRREKFLAANPTPYERWEDGATEYIGAVKDVIEARGEGMVCSLTWKKGRADRVRDLTIRDLAIALFAVDRVGKDGLSYGQIAKCFSRCVGTGCHSAKAAALLRALAGLALIEKQANYSVGVRGNCYVRRKSKPDETWTFTFSAGSDTKR